MIYDNTDDSLRNNVQYYLRAGAQGRLRVGLIIPTQT